MNFDTRLVDSRLQIEFQCLDDSILPKVTEEYESLNQAHNSSIDRWLGTLKAKSGDCKCGGGSMVLGEMLAQIYKKLEHIENLISGDSARYVDLGEIAHTSKLGHGVILLVDGYKDLQIDKEYYGRLLLPLFPSRQVPLVAVAIGPQALSVTKMGERDLKDYDSYIVGVEREMLRARRSV